VIEAVDQREALIEEPLRLGVLRGDGMMQAPEPGQEDRPFVGGRRLRLVLLRVRHEQ